MAKALQIAERVKSALCCYVSSMRLFGGWECSKGHQAPVQLDSCLPSSPVALDAKNAGMRVAFGFEPVLAVLGRSCFPQIAKPVVGWVAIDVVNEVCRPVSVNDGPCNSVRVNLAPSNLNAPFAAFIKASPHAGADFAIPRHFPSEFTGIRLVLQQVAEFINRQFVHCLSFINGRIAGGCGKVAMNHRFAR